MEDNKKYSGTFTNFVSTLLAIVFFAIAANIVVQLWPIDVLEIQNSEILTPIVEAGKEVSWKNFYCKKTEVPATVYRQLRDQDNTIWLTAVAYGVKGPGCATAIVSMTVPVNAKSGSYVIDNAVVFEVNRVRTVTVNYTTPEFKVVQPVIVTKPNLTPVSEDRPVNSLTPLAQPSPQLEPSVLQPALN